MNFNYTKSVFIAASMDTVWRKITDQYFEHEFFPEINRRPSTKPTFTEVELVKSIAWEAGAEVKIELTRKDLNVTIDTIQISLTSRGDGVDATIFVTYNKMFEKNFVLAHSAIRGLFSTKLHVLKSDCREFTTELDYLPSVRFG